MPKIAPIHYRKLAKIFESQGFIYIKTKGDHLVYKKEGIERPVIIPMYKEIPKFIILNNLKTAEITREKYLTLLKKKSK